MQDFPTGWREGGVQAPGLAMVVLCCATLVAEAGANGRAEPRPPEPTRAQAVGPWAACGRLIDRAEREHGIPRGLLRAIALVESGRRNPATGALEPWPWSFNHRGEPHVFGNRAEAVEAAGALLGQGERSIDVGCMQVNLHFHGAAFASMEEAFDPAANVAYAARMLVGLRRRMGGWVAAAAHYHSATPRRQDVYLARLLAAWAAGGPQGPGDAALPGPAPRGAVRELAEAPP